MITESPQRSVSSKAKTLLSIDAKIRLFLSVSASRRPCHTHLWAAFPDGKYELG